MNWRHAEFLGGKSELRGLGLLSVCVCVCVCFLWPQQGRKGQMKMSVIKVSQDCNDQLFRFMSRAMRAEPRASPRSLPRLCGGARDHGKH